MESGKKTKDGLKQLSVIELRDLLASNADIQLIDVREPWEKKKCDIGGELIPVGQVGQFLDKFSKEKMVVVYCRSGIRSASAIKYVEFELELTNLYNLDGGILAWASQVDSRIEKY